MIKTLMRGGLDLTSKNDDGQTALFGAISKGD